MVKATALDKARRGRKCPKPKPQSAQIGPDGPKHPGNRQLYDKRGRPDAGARLYADYPNPKVATFCAALWLTFTLPLTVGRLMRQNAICVVRTRKFKATTDSDHTFNIAPNLLQQDFAASQLNQKWAGDITYVWTREGWVYLAVILDLHSRRVIALRDLHANPFRVTAGPSATG